MTNIQELITQKINMPQINGIVLWASGNSDNLSQLWHYACSGDRTTSVNALWAMTHLPDADAPWIHSLRSEMIDMLLATSDTAKKRLLLRILRNQEYSADDIPTRLLDYCLSKINSQCEPYAIRCFSIYAAFNMCRHYPELIDELDCHLDMMNGQSLSPGLRSALRQTKARIKKSRASFPKN